MSCNNMAMRITGMVTSAGAAVSYDPTTGGLKIGSQVIVPITEVTKADGTSVPVAPGGGLELPNYLLSMIDAAGNPVLPDASGALTLPAETAAQTPFTAIPGNAATDVQGAIANLQTLASGAVPKCGYTPGQGLVVDAAGCIATSGKPAISELLDGSGVPIVPNASGAVALPTYVKAANGASGSLTVSPTGVLTIPAETATQTPFTPIPGNTATDVQGAIANLQTLASGAVPAGAALAPSGAMVTNAAGEAVTLPNPGAYAIMIFNPVTGAPEWKVPVSMFGRPVEF
jgi:hypothetical protein